MTRILCIEDEPTLLRTLGANLRARGYDIDLATSGEIGLEVAAAKKPDIVIVDPHSGLGDEEAPRLGLLSSELIAALRDPLRRSAAGGG